MSRSGSRRQSTCSGPTARTQIPATTPESTPPETATTAPRRRNRRIAVAVSSTRLQGKRAASNGTPGGASPRPSVADTSILRGFDQSHDGAQTVVNSRVALAMSICCTSSVPSPMVRIFASR